MQYPVFIFSIIMHHFLLNCNFRTVKNRRFVHVVPDVNILPCALKLVEFKLFLPPIVGFVFDKINPRGLTRPAPSFIIGLVCLFDEEILGFTLITDAIVFSTFNVRIDDSNKLEKERKGVRHQIQTIPC
jgi:hypothetical protein